MAKIKKWKWQETSIVVLFVLLILTNLYWMHFYNSHKWEVDNARETGFNALVKSTALEACYKNNDHPCNVPPYQHFMVPKTR